MGLVIAQCTVDYVGRLTAHLPSARCTSYLGVSLPTVRWAPGGPLSSPMTLGKAGLLKPLPDDPVEASRGILKGKTSLTKALLKDRREEAKRG